MVGPTTAPKIPASIGPISGDINILATRVTLLDSTMETFEYDSLDDMDIGFGFELQLILI